MPAVLIECGFISNPDDLAALRTEEGIDGIAEGILKAFKAFKGRYDGVTVQQDSQPKTEAKPEATPEAKPEQKQEPAPEVKAGETVYGTQVLATGKKMSENDPFFKGEIFFVVEGAKINRYLVGFSTDREEAKKNNERLKKIFPDSFFVKAENGKTVLDR